MYWSKDWFSELTIVIMKMVNVRKATLGVMG